MNEQWTLPIEDKVLLAEKVMGWRQINHKWQRVDVGFSVGFFSTEDGRFIHYPPYGSKWVDWQPETNEGDAVQLFLKTPLAFVTNLNNGDIQAGIAEFSIFVESSDFCEATCRMVLEYIRKSQVIL